MKVILVLILIVLIDARSLKPDWDDSDDDKKKSH